MQLDGGKGNQSEAGKRAKPEITSQPNDRSSRSGASPQCLPQGGVERPDMPVRRRTDFANQEEWISYVRDCVPVVEREYVLACGRTELFKSFYEVRRQEFPAEYTQELRRIQTLSEPRRTDSLEHLNERIFAGLTDLLFRQTQLKRLEAAPLAP